jgi:hypothetical protein
MFTLPTIKRLIEKVLPMIGLAVLSSCAMSRVNLVEQGQVKLVIVPSKTHGFEKSVVFQDGDELIVYGKIRNRTGFCMQQGHVDLVIIDPKGTILEKASIPYVERGQRRKGWSGAHFRTRFRQKLSPHSIVRLAFDDENCFTSVRDDHNVAMPLRSDAGEKTQPRRF